MSTVPILSLVSLVLSLFALAVSFPGLMWWRRRAIEMERERNFAMKLAAAYRDGNVPEAKRLATEEYARLRSPSEKT